jgi:cardiolipin synthase
MRHAAPLLDGHQVKLLQGGQDFFPALVEAVDASEHEVRLETYIFSFDASGEQVAGALVRAAMRGVAVYLVMDGAGTSGVPVHWEKRFLETGVQWRIYSPLGGLGWFMPSSWRRLHRKLCVVDGRIVFCGGINVLDDFHDPNHGSLAAPRVDFAVRVTGPLVLAADDAVTQFWWRLKAATSARDRKFSTALAALLASVGIGKREPSPDNEGRARPRAKGAKAHTGSAAAHTVRAGLLLRDNLRHRTQIERAYRKAIGEARHEIIIANAYFLPGARLRRGLIHAAKRGVRVRLLLQGRYEYFMQYHASRPVYGALLAQGVEIFEYAESFLHAKVAVIDSRWATVGSSNLDPLSLLLAREANVVVDDAVFAKDLQVRLEHAMAHGGQRVDPAVHARRAWHQRCLSWMAYGLMRVMLLVSGKRY